MKDIIIDFSTRQIINGKIEAIQGDNTTKKIKILLKENSLPYNLTGKSVMLTMKKNSSNSYVNKGDFLTLNITSPTNGEVELPINKDFTKEKGGYQLQLSVLDESEFEENSILFEAVIYTNLKEEVSGTLVESVIFKEIKQTLQTVKDIAKNEQARQEAEIKRQEYIENTVKPEVAKIDEFGSQVTNIQNEFDKAVANVTNGNESATNSEIVQARGKAINLGARIDGIDSQLSDISNNTNVKKPNSVVTFISDDGQLEEYTKYKDFCKRMNIKTGLAIIPEVLGNENFLTLEQLKELVADGHYVLGHGLTKLTNLTLEEVENNFKNCIDLGKQLGQDITQYAYPEGVSNPDIRRLVRKYFKAGYKTGNKYNTTPINTTLINRPMFGSYEIPELNTLEGFKKVIDSAVENDAWVVFCMHSGSTTEQRWKDFEELINYIRSKDIDIVTPEVGFEMYKNVVDIIDEDNNKGFRVGNDGTAYSDAIKDSKIIVREYSGINISTPLTSEKFKYGYKTIDSFLFNDNSEFPFGAGTLETFKPNKVFDIGCGYQKWIPYGKNYIQIRPWLPNSNKWGEFSKIETSLVIVEGVNNRTASESINAFQKGITYTPISASFAQNNGFPSSKGGMLVTENLYSENGFQRQYFKVFNSKTELIRNVNSDGTWGEWDNIARIKKGFTTINGFTIGAGQTVEKAFNLNGVDLASCVCATPDMVLETGIIWSCYVNSVGSITIRFFNTTNQEKILNSRVWRFSAIN